MPTPDSDTAITDTPGTTRNMSTREDSTQCTSSLEDLSPGYGGDPFCIPGSYQTRPQCIGIGRWPGEGLYCIERHSSQFALVVKSKIFCVVSTNVNYSLYYLETRFYLHTFKLQGFVNLLLDELNKESYRNILCQIPRWTTPQFKNLEKVESLSESRCGNCANCIIVCEADLYILMLDVRACVRV